MIYKFKTSTLIIFLTILAIVSCKNGGNLEEHVNQSTNTYEDLQIPIEHLTMNLSVDQKVREKIVLEKEIPGIQVQHVTLTGKTINYTTKNRQKDIYLFISGNGKVTAGDTNFEIVPETILLPNSINTIAVQATVNDTLNFLKISSNLTNQDIKDLNEFPKENTQHVYYRKFIDCEAYTEPIKSPNTVSRTILPNKYLPRIAMGTVQTKGPDKVAPHEHGMLEQLFLGLTDNKVIVYADDAQVDFPEHSILHIPLGSSHSVEALDGDEMYYVWMDFFRDKAGEEWLKTHNTVEE